MRTLTAVMAGVVLVLGGVARADVPECDFSEAGGPAFHLSAGGLLSFDNLSVTASRYAGDTLGCKIEIADLAIDPASRQFMAWADTFNTYTGAWYTLSSGVATFRIFDNSGTMPYLSGALSFDSVAMTHGTNVVRLFNLATPHDQVTGLLLSNSPPMQTLLDFGAIGKADLALSLSVSADAFDNWLQTAQAGTGGADGRFSAIPEPATMGLLGLGLAGLVARRRKR